ncbi:TPA: hypothetical protein I6Z08_000549 [Vibrio cholerae]|nr:hypothetical protein [Vibrio cholerae]HAS3159409.1 hypothetical protein [Vibrio cholerae]
MKRMKLSTLMALTALTLFGATSHARAADSSVTQSNEVSNIASPDEYPVVLPAQVSGLGGDLNVRAYAIKHLYETMVISYYGRHGLLVDKDEYGYGTHDIDSVLSVEVKKTFAVPPEMILVSIKDENGDILASQATDICSITHFC